MSIMLSVILTLIIFLLIVGLALFIMAQNENKQKQNKINLIKGHGSSKSEVNEKGLRDKRRAEIAKKLKDSGDGGGGNRKKGIASMLEQAGFHDTPVKRFWIYSAICCVFCVIIASVMKASPLVLVFVAVTGFFGLPRFFLKKKIEKRQKKFLGEFADALEAMVRLLKAGMPVSEAILMASKEFDGPVGEEMSRIYDSQKIGVPLAEATVEASYRMPVTEMQMFATGIAIQAQTGASLSEVLMNLAGVIRARFRLKRKVQALSSEAKASAMIIGCLPLLVGTGLYFINRDFIMLLFTTPMGKSMLGGGVIWMSIGIFIMRAMINFKV